MKIQTDPEGRKAIEALCDVALKAGGIKNLAGITQVLTSIRMIKPEPEPVRTDDSKELKNE